MQSLSLKHLLVLAASASLAVAAGTSCDSSVAFPLNPPSGSSTTGGTGGTGSTGTTGGSGAIGGCDSQCQLSSLEQTQQMNDIWASGSSLLSGSVKNRKRQSSSATLPPLICTDSELCVADGSVLFCLNAATYNFHDMFGGTGNVETGLYVVPSALAAAPGATFTAGATINLNDPAVTATGTQKSGTAKATKSGSSGSSSTGAALSNSGATSVAPYLGGGVLGAFSFLIGLL